MILFNRLPRSLPVLVLIAFITAAEFAFRLQAGELFEQRYQALIENKTGQTDADRLRSYSRFVGNTR